MNPQNYIIYNVTIAKPTHRNRKESNDYRSREVTEEEDVAIADYWDLMMLSENPFSKTDIRQNQRFAQQTTYDSEDKSPETPPVERLSPLHKQKRRNKVRLSLWRWRESNSRPNKESKSFLHAQLPFNPSVKIRQTTAKTLTPAPKSRTIIEAHIALSLKR